MAIAGRDCDRLESLEELISAIDMGLDIEFDLYGTRYNISTNGKPFIAQCPEGDALYFDSAKDMVERHKVNGNALKDIWHDLEILAM